MSPLYAWERSTWDRHPFRALRNQPYRRHRRYTACGLPLALLSSSVSIPDRRHRCTRHQHTDDYPASTTTATRTHAHAAADHREPETKFSATSPPSMLSITRCSWYEIERPRRFSTPAVTLFAAPRGERRARCWLRRTGNGTPWIVFIAGGRWEFLIAKVLGRMFDASLYFG